MNVARINFSHGDHAEHLAKIETIKRVREKLGMPIAIMLDTKGPEYRIRTFENGKITLREGAPFTLTVDDVVGDETRVSVNYEGLVNDLAPGDRVLLANGLMALRVDEIVGHDIHCTVTEGGELSDRKSMSFPNKVLKQAYLSEQDKLDMLFGVEHGVDYIACSFVSVRQDLVDVHEFLNAHGGENISLIAKIENQSGIDNIESICEECEGIMIGRGDMGVEIPFEKLPAIQKQLITKCRMLGKRVITATEMLESMIHKPRPTRAETSDVANAIYDGSSAIMLSGETAAGEYPVLTLQTMARIAEQTESDIHYESRFRKAEFTIQNTVDAISHSVCGMAIDLDAKAIAVCSISGKTVRMVSRFRSPATILGITTDERSWRHLALSWGVLPVMCDTFDSTDVLFYTAKQLAKQHLKLKSGDKIIITGGIANGVSGNTNLIKVEKI